MRNIIIFDIGGVLRIFNQELLFGWLQKTFNTTQDISYIWKKWEISKDVDEISDYKFYSNILRELNISQSNLSKDTFFNKFLDEYTQTNHDLFNHIKNNLFKRYKLFIFSNMSRFEVRKHREIYDYEKYFEKCIYSYDLKLVKPEINFFKKGLMLIGCKGEECIFFDDMLKNKKNSEKVGIKFIQYTNYYKFIKDCKILKL